MARVRRKTCGAWWFGSTTCCSIITPSAVIRAPHTSLRTSSLGAAAAPREAVLGAGLSKVILVLGVTSWIMYARVVRGEVLAVRGRDYVLAARALGGSDWLLLRRHILPNVVGPVVVISSKPSQPYSTW